MINALTIDLENWWCNEFLNDYLSKNKESQIEESLNPVLKLLDDYDVSSTFFI